MILAGAPHQTATRGRRRGPSFEPVAVEWLAHGERKRGLKLSTLKDCRSLLNHLLPAFGERPLRAITRQEIERWQAGYERIRRPGRR